MENKICEHCGGALLQKGDNFFECGFCGKKSSAYNYNNIDVVERTRMNIKIIEYDKQANKLFSEDDYLGALKLFNEILALDANNVDALVSIGRCYRGLDMCDEAIAFYKKALELKEKPTIYANIAVAYLCDKKYAESVPYFNKALDCYKSGEEYWKIYANFAVSVSKLGDPARASQMIAEAERHGNKNGDAYRKLAGLI